MQTTKMARVVHLQLKAGGVEECDGETEAEEMEALGMRHIQ